MSLVATRTYEEGTDGANVVSGTNGVIAISGAVKYSATAAVHGSMGIAVPASGGIGYSATPSGQYSFYWSDYVIGSGASLLSSIRTSTNVFLLRLRMNSVNGKYEITDSGSVLKATSTSLINALQKGRADVRYVYDSGAGTLTTTIRLFLGANFNGSTPDETLGPIVTTASAAPGRVYIGTTSADWTRVGIDSFRIYDDVTTWPVPYVVVPEFIYAMSGGARESSVQIKAKVLNAGTARLKYSTDSGLVGGGFTSSDSPDSDGYLEWTLSGLTPNTKYYYQVMHTPLGGSESAIGDICSTRTRTTSGGSDPIKIAMGSSTLTATTQADDAFANLVAWDPHLLLHLGDAYFNGSTATSAATHRAKWDDQVAAVDEWRDALQSVCLEYTNSDHELNPDNVDTNTANAALWNEFFAKTIPHVDLVDSDPTPVSKHRSWVDSKIRFIMLDVKNTDRSPGLDADGPSKTMLGASQLSWLLTELVQPELLKVIISVVPWSKTAEVVSGRQDAWWSYANERQIIADFITDHNINVDFLHADLRRLAVDATHNDWGDFPVICASPFSQNASPTELAAFFDQNWPTSGTGPISVYMRLTYEWLDADTVQRTASGWDAVGNVQRVSLVSTWERSGIPGLAMVFIKSAGGSAVPINVYRKNSSGSAELISAINTSS